MQIAKPRGFWNEKKNQKLFFEELAQKLGILEWKDWYKVRYVEIMLVTREEGKILQNMGVHS